MPCECRHHDPVSDLLHVADQLAAVEQLKLLSPAERQAIQPICYQLLRVAANRPSNGFLRMVAADSRQFPWIADEFAAVMGPQNERLIRYLAYLTAIGILDCRNPLLAAHQFMGLLNEFSLWPWMMGSERVPVSDKDIVESAVRMFLQHYRRPPPKKERSRQRSLTA